MVARIPGAIRYSGNYSVFQVMSRRILAEVPQRLNRLWKNSEFRIELAELIPLGLKLHSFYWLYRHD